EKNRFSRWGPYVNPTGLIIVLLAALVRMSPIMFLDGFVWVREGEQKVLPSTDSEYFIEKKKFTLETYDAEDEENEKFKDAIEQKGMIEKNYQTDAVIYKAKDKEIAGEEEELEKVKEGSLQMNKPMKFDGYTLYQSGYQENEFSD